MKFYNIKKRMFSNGFTEIRFFQKAICVGNVRKKIKKMITKIDIPFESEKVECREIKGDIVVDSKGFTVNPVSKYVLYKSMKRTRDKIFDYANSCNWEWFCTFTFNNTIDRFDYDIVSKKMSDWLSNVRRLYCKDLKYLIVPEKHKNGAYHFHALFSNADNLRFVQAVNNQRYLKNGKKNKYFGQPLVRKGEQVYNITTFHFGYTDCTKVKDTKKVANYVLKYITKDMIKDIKNRKRYWVSRNLDKIEEHTYLIDYGNYDDTVTDLLAEFVKRNKSVHFHDFFLDHVDFQNKISYFKYDRNICDVEFSSILQI